LTIKSYNSDITRYLDWTTKRLPRTNLAQVLSDKNIKIYLNHLLDSGSAITSTIDRKDKSLARFQAWYTQIYSPTHAPDNNEDRSHTRYEGLPHTGYVIPSHTQMSHPDQSSKSVKNFNYRNLITLRHPHAVCRCPYHLWLPPILT
jgi:hypothetical protein